MDPLCKSYTSSLSACSSCYGGYTLVSGQCVISTNVPNTNNDPYCIKSQGSSCLTCANGYYLSSSGVCNQLNPLCKSSDMNTGNCLDCYPGYTLSSITCIVAASVNIPYCVTVTGNVCSLCISGYYVSNGGCALANVLCSTYDLNTGACLSCVTGYVFQNATCILPSLGIDPNCVQYSNSYCTTCATGYSLQNYYCTAIDPNCIQFDSVNNVCQQCGGGKTPQGPNCY
jgi:hypothetical protein